MGGEAAIFPDALPDSMPRNARFDWSLFGRVMVSDLVGESFFVLRIAFSEQVGKQLSVGDMPTRDCFFVFRCSGDLGWFLLLLAFSFVLRNFRSLEAFFLK